MSNNYREKVKDRLKKRGIQIIPFRFSEEECKKFWESGWIDCGEFKMFGHPYRYMGFKPPEK